MGPRSGDRKATPLSNQLLMPPPSPGRAGCTSGVFGRYSHKGRTLGSPFATVYLELGQISPLFDPSKHLLDAAAEID
jgi:hypothetical protein